MGKVVETSFHHINGKHGKSGHGGQTVSRKFPCHGFSVKPIPSDLASDRRMQVQPDRRRCRCQALNVARTECASGGSKLFEYKYSVLIFCYGRW
jgi:hypothetical protein